MKYSPKHCPRAGVILLSAASYDAFTRAVLPSVHFVRARNSYTKSKLWQRPAGSSSNAFYSRTLRTNKSTALSKYASLFRLSAGSAAKIRVRALVIPYFVSQPELDWIPALESCSSILLATQVHTSLTGSSATCQRILTSI